MKNLPLSIFDSYEYYTLSTRVYDIAKKLPTDPYMVALCNKIKTGMTGMEKAMGKSLKSSFTSLLVELDRDRDNPFLGLRDHVHSLTHSKDAAKASAAVHLSEIIEGIGNRINNLGYADQTAKMKTLITAMSGTEPTQWLETTAGDPWFDEMVTAEKAFEDAYNSKNATETSINIPLLNESKALIATPLKGLLSYVENNADGISPVVFKPMEAEIDAVITDMVAIARNRITRVEKEKKEEGTPQTPKP